MTSRFTQVECEEAGVTGSTFNSEALVLSRFPKRTRKCLRVLFTREVKLEREIGRGLRVAIERIKS